MSRHGFHAHATQCPFCGKKNDLAGNIGGETLAPMDGDASFCIDCGLVSVFDHSAPDGCRPPTDEEAYHFGQDEGIRRLRAIWEAVPPPLKP